MTFVITFLTLLGFIMHSIQQFLIFFSPNSCKVITAGVDFLTFCDQSVFFIVFIWVIFKMIEIWKMMIHEDEEDQIKERRYLFKC